MNSTQTIQSRVYEGQTLYTLARLVRASGALVTQSDVTGNYTVTVYRYNNSTPGTAVYTDSSVLVSSTIFDTLQTDGYWDVDATGYNFRHSFVVGGSLPEFQGGNTYVAEYTIPLSSPTETIYVRHKFELAPILSATASI